MSPLFSVHGGIIGYSLLDSDQHFGQLPSGKIIFVNYKDI